MSGSQVTTLCHLWQLTRRDGLVQGFTDHDQDLRRLDLLFRAASGLGASALVQGSGLAVDNSEALGALSVTGLAEADLVAGRYDGAEVTVWRADWQDPQPPRRLFRGQLGEISRHGQSFKAELRGLSEPLNQPMGRVYARVCAAVLGDRSCGFDTQTLGYAASLTVQAVDAAAQLFDLGPLAGYEPGWFSHGRLVMTSGAALGLSCLIKQDTGEAAMRRILLWQSLRAPVLPGDQLQVVAGCDKYPQTCRMKFNNLINFQGFPFLPGEDWLTRYPSQDRPASGGSLRTPA